MALIKDRSIAVNSWRRLESETALVEGLPEGDLLVSLELWVAHCDRLRAHAGRLGVWLGGSDDPERLVGAFPDLALIAVHFPSFTDGRGYSTGRLLRSRYGWRGELRAIGDVQRDQLFYLARCGFDAFELREGEDAGRALEAYGDFSDTYQAAVDQPLPLFRRREAASGEA